jgi:hypothetical protein
MILLGAFCFLLMVKPMYERVSKLFKPLRAWGLVGFVSLVMMSGRGLSLCFLLGLGLIGLGLMIDS